jgi:hypothetical protein
MLEDKHNHCIDALRYACEGARKAVRPNHWADQIQQRRDHMSDAYQKHPMVAYVREALAASVRWSHLTTA